VPVQVLTLHVWPSAQRFQINAVFWSVTVPSPLSIKFVAADAGVAAMQPKASREAKKAPRITPPRYLVARRIHRASFEIIRGIICSFVSLVLALLDSTSIQNSPTIDASGHATKSRRKQYMLAAQRLRTGSLSGNPPDAQRKIVCAPTLVCVCYLNSTRR
jgi:hypothetical protein